MSQKFPYTPTSKALVQFLNQLRKSFPANIDAGILKKLGLAPNNESYILSVIRFLGLIDEKGDRNSNHQQLFSVADNAKFAEGFAKVVHGAYKELFNVRGEEAWALDKPSLSTFFRQSDGTSAIIGDRQVNTFVALAEFSGKRSSAGSSRSTLAKDPKKKILQSSSAGREKGGSSGKAKPDSSADSGSVLKKHGKLEISREVGISVKVEVILPTDASEETYDNIFRSIRKNLIE